MSTLVSWVLAAVLSFFGVDSTSKTDLALDTEVIQHSSTYIGQGYQCIKNEQLISNDTF